MEELKKLFNRISRKYRSLSPEKKKQIKSAGTGVMMVLVFLLLRRLRAAAKTPMIRTVAMSEMLRRLRPTDKVEFRPSGVVLVPTLGLASFLVPGGEEMITKSIIAKVRDFGFVPEEVSVLKTMFGVAFPIALIVGWFQAVKSLIHPP